MDEEWRLFSGTGHVTVARDGGRIAELCPLADGPNLLWRGDAVLPITGGDRLWLGPERDVFYPPDDRQRDAWRCPEELDPGSWSLKDADGAVQVFQHALGASMSRRITALSEAPVACDLPWTAVRVDEEVGTEAALSGWHLTMCPTPSSLFVRDPRDALALYGPAQTDDDGWLHATGEAPEWKMGFAAPVDGRLVLAAVGDGDPGPLVALIADLPPEATYLEVRPLDDAGPCAVEVYNAPGFGFCELEFHFPLESRAGSTILFGAWGSRAERLDVLRRVAG